VKHGKTFLAPDSLTRKIMDVGLNDIRILEEPRYEHEGP
jgi:hypothetical protein